MILRKIKVLLIIIHHKYLLIYLMILGMLNNPDIIFPYYTNYLHTESQQWHTDNVLMGRIDGVKHKLTT